MKETRTISQMPYSEGGYTSLVTVQPDGLKNLSVIVSGVHCAMCIQKIESSLLQDNTVRMARLNFSTGRLNISWDGVEGFSNKLVETVQSLGYVVRPYTADLEKSTMEEENKFLLMCLGVAGFAMGNIMLLSIGLWTTTSDTMGLATRDLMHWISALIAIPAVLFSGRPFFRSAFGALSKGHTNMDVPISIGLILASVMSLFETARHGEHVYFDSAVMLMFFLLIGRYLDFRARRSARSAATDLMSTLSGFANVESDSKTFLIPVRDLREGMIVLVSTGEKFPVDGFLLSSFASVDTSLVTGETLPRDIKEGEMLYAGTLNLSSPVKVRVAKAAEDSLLADIVRLMEKAEQGQAKYVRLADKAARLYTPVVHTLAALGFIVWWAGFHIPWQDALMISVTILIITCPCALGLAVPVVQVLATGLLMKNGILVKSGDALERLADIDTILIDKTGTITLGIPSLKGVYDSEDLQIAASLASHSRHPLSQAISRAYKGNLLDVTSVEEHAGLGLSGFIDGRLVKLGSPAWCGIGMSQQSEDMQIWMQADGLPPVQFTMTDIIRDDARTVLQNFIKKGLSVILLSGDRQAVAARIAKETGIETVYAEKSPVEKFRILEELKAKGHRIAMVGDGLNDAPSLAGADVSIAPGTAIDMAQNAADIVFMGEKLLPLEQVYVIAEFTQKLVKQNFTIAVIYNIIAIPMAFMGMVTPFVAAIAMSGSSLLVIANAFRLKGVVR